MLPHQRNPKGRRLVTELVHKEAFCGLLSSPILASMHGDTKRSFGAMNLALRNQVGAIATLEE